MEQQTAQLRLDNAAQISRLNEQHSRDISEQSKQQDALRQ